MRRTREQFIEMFQYRLAGMVLFMQADDIRDAGRLGRADAAARRIFETPEEIRKLLGQMYDSLTPEKASENGKPAAPAAQPQVKR